VTAITGIINRGERNNEGKRLINLKKKKNPNFWVKTSLRLAEPNAEIYRSNPEGKGMGV